MSQVTMNYLLWFAYCSCFLLSIVQTNHVLLLAQAQQVGGQQAGGGSLVQQSMQQSAVGGVQQPQLPANYPYYLQSPHIASPKPMQMPKSLLTGEQLASAVAASSSSSVSDQTQEQQLQSMSQSQVIESNGEPNINSLTQRTIHVAKGPQAANRNKETFGSQESNNNLADSKCLYDKKYFENLDECLVKRPYPIVGLPAFKNEDLLVKRGLLSERNGCVFILNNGIFKNYQIGKYFVESDSQCLDSSKIGLSMNFSNLTMTYLWTLRCLNRADQLLDDSTLSGYTSSSEISSTSDQIEGEISSQDKQNTNSICVGSSQNFGFASLQLSTIEAQVELTTDVYKNWRITNITLAMPIPTVPVTLTSSTSLPTISNKNKSGIDVSGSNDPHETPFAGTNIKDYTFESLDGDELNWRYLHLFQNWSRNKMHTNFLDQYRRFLWVSLQRCLSESSEKLPVKLKDVFSN